ncbi:uncharacterized protein LOC118646826 [Monomorium pharaonis]|uniref:uncharacterized protein LOC118646826 n=1 Tax=Monomorium pharaonis TaxID=307658 RepID=UPI0017467A63|nr:uncharacterized protein LOC118646826 [Monomorium pharaonis]
MNGPTTKCGYCGFILRRSCGTILDHHCFVAYDKNTDVTQQIPNINPVTTSSAVYCVTPLILTLLNTTSAVTQDELLIELVRTRRALWDHFIPLNQKTKLKKDNLWQEIVNLLQIKY